VMAGNPIKLSAFADSEVRKTAPKLDADRAAILAQIAARELLGEGATVQAQALADALLAEPGDAAEAAVVGDLVRLVNASDSAALAQILDLLARRYAPDPCRISEAVDRWRADPSADNLKALTQAVEPPRREIFRRMSTAPGGRAVLLKLRAELLLCSVSNPELAPVEADLHHLLRS
jgi:malonyl-CoA decarboxylase